MHAALVALLWTALPPEAAVGRFDVCQGFQVTLVAAEPLITQPVCIEFDDRGRLWVVQYRQYPNPAGLKRVSVDRYSRTEYDRIPEPPPKGPRGADRITILEDADGDGRADRSTDFVDGLNLASGIAFGHGGVFVLQVPYLLFYPDRNRDDRPDADPEVLLTGFGMQDAHSVANSLTWGPDGWLYGCQGSTVTSRIAVFGTRPRVPDAVLTPQAPTPENSLRVARKRPGDEEIIAFQQGVWRYHPRTRAFELFCEGGGNAWGLDFDADGRLLYSTNFGGYVLVHGVQGGYYVKSFGKHGALHNPYAFGYFEHAAHQNFKGGHVTVGGIVYQGNLFPPEFRGRYLAGDLLGHGVYWHDVIPEGTTFRTAHAGELLRSQDPWFAPSDVTQGPDGAVYVADWHDARMAHPDPDAEWDRTNGRVFRIAPSQASSSEPLPDIVQRSSTELLEMLDSRNSWLVRRARRILAERRDPDVASTLRQRIDTEAPQQALEALWAFHGSQGIDDALALPLLSHSSPRIREWTVRLLGDDWRSGVRINRSDAPIPDAIADALLHQAVDPDRHVRAQVAATAKRLPGAIGLPLAQRVFQASGSVQDPHIPLLCWWAIEQHAITSLDLCRELFARRESFETQGFVLERLMRRWGAEGTAAAWNACAELLAHAPDDAQRKTLIAALEAGLRDYGRTPTVDQRGTLFTSAAQARLPTASPSQSRTPELPPSLNAQLRYLWTPTTTEAPLIRLLAGQNDAAAIDRWRAIIADRGVDPKLRVELLAYAPSNVADLQKLLSKLLATNEPEAVRLAAIEALAADDAAGPVLLNAYPDATGRMRDRLRTALFSRRDWALPLLQRIDVEPRFPKSDAPLDQLRLLALHHDAAIDARVRQLWGSVSSGTPEEKLAEMRRLNNDLRAGAGDPQRGAAAFQKSCAACHQLGAVGTKLGPDLTHANRQDREFLLTSLVDPSAAVRAEYLNYIVVTVQGRVATGLIAAQSPGEITLVDAKNQRLTIRRDEVETLQESTTSFMPENLLKPLSPQELRDLFAYLQSAPAGPSP